MSKRCKHSFIENNYVSCVFKSKGGKLNETHHGVAKKLTDRHHIVLLYIIACMWNCD